MNFFQKARKLKIQHQILLLVTLSMVVPASIVGIFGVLSASNSLSASATTALQEEVDDKVEEFDDFLTGVSDTVVFISRLPDIQGLLRAQANGGTDPEDGSSEEVLKERLRGTFVELLREKSYYKQFRYIDAEGNEVLRVDSDGEVVQVIPDAELQNKADRPYFTETVGVPAGEVYISPVNLNQENGQVEEPFVPVIRYGTPVVDEAGTVQGMIVANIFANQFIEQFANVNTEANLEQSDEVILVNQDGYYLYHENTEKTWGFDLGKDDETLAKDFAPDAVEQILSNNAGVVDVGSDLLAFNTFVPDPAQPNALVAIARVPKGEVFALVNRFTLLSGLVVLGSLSVGIPVALLRGRQLVGLIENLVTNISTSIQETASTIAEQERIANQQATSVNETTTTMDELEASSRHASEQANAATEAAKKAFKSSEVGTEAVSQGLEGMFALEQKVEAISEQIVNLSGQASQISNISQLVIDFANQTNMLALNSSVEAVRAGEHGKGFAVVANEIRKLSDQSQQSADKINGLVSDIQKSINETVMVAEEGTKTVKTGVQIAKRTESAFGEVKDAVNQVVLNNQQVSLNLKQQVNAIQQVVDAMEVINQGARETASGLTQTKVGTEQLNDAAFGLQQMV